MIHEISRHPLDIQNHYCDRCGSKLFRHAFAYQVEGYPKDYFCHECAMAVTEEEESEAATDEECV